MYIINQQIIQLISIKNNKITKTMSEIVIKKETQTNAFFQFVKKNQYAILTALGVFSAAGLYYLSTIINKHNNNHKQTSKDTTITINKQKTHPIPTPQSTTRQHPLTPQQQTRQIKHTLQRLKSRRQKLLTVSHQLKLQYAEQQILTPLLSQQCVLNIFDLCKQLVDEQELNGIYIKNRKARRQVFNHILVNAQIANVRRQSVQMEGSVQVNYHNSQEMNIHDSMQLHITSPKHITSIKNSLRLKKLPITYPQALSFSQLYYRLVCTFEQDFKYLIEKTQKDFAVFLNIDFSLITQSIDFHISKQDNQYFKSKTQEWTSLIKQSLKQLIYVIQLRTKLNQYNYPIHVDRVCDILRHQIYYLTEKRQLILQMVRKLGISDEQQLQAIPTFIECVLEDQVYSRFGVEMEQITVEMGQMDKNRQLEMLAREFQQLVEGIVREMYEEVNTEDIHYGVEGFDDSIDGE